MHDGGRVDLSSRQLWPLEANFPNHLDGEVTSAHHFNGACIQIPREQGELIAYPGSCLLCFFPTVEGLIKSRDAAW